MTLQFLYHAMHYPPCASCGAKPSPRQGPYIHHSPDANTVSDYFQQTGFSLNISASDLICKSYYDMYDCAEKINKQLDTRESKLESDIELWIFIAQETDIDKCHKSSNKNISFGGIDASLGKIKLTCFHKQSLFLLSILSQVVHERMKET